MAKKLSPWAIVAGVALILALTASTTIAIVQSSALRTEKQAQASSIAAEKAKEEAYREILETPSGDLIDDSPHAEALRGARDAHVDEFTADAADRIREILSRRSGQGTP